LRPEWAKKRIAVVAITGNSIITDRQHEDAGCGWRRVIASPIPLEIIELGAIRTFVDQGFIVIAVSGGGTRVVKDKAGNLTGICAVIDKDRATSLLAQELETDFFLISLAIP